MRVSFRPYQKRRRLSVRILLPDFRVRFASNACQDVSQEKCTHTVLNSLSSRMSHVLGLGERAKPFVTLTYAQSLDGCTARRSSDRLMLSGPASLALTHKLRAMHDTILIGIGTLLADNPKLTVRLAPGHNPLPVVLDSNLNTPHTSQLVTAAAGRSPKHGLIVITTEGGDSGKAQRRNQLEALPGVHVRSVPSCPAGSGVHLLEALIMLKDEFGMHSVMVEGGTQLIGAFLADAQELIDFSVLTIAPCFVGGVGPASPFGKIQANRSRDMLVNMIDLKTCQLGDDFIISGRPKQEALNQLHIPSLPGKAETPVIFKHTGPRLVSECKMWIDHIHAECSLRVYSVPDLDQEIIALVKGNIKDAELVPLRVHSECFTGDILGSMRCDCGGQLDAFLKILNVEDRGVLLYVKGHEGRGIGLANKILAYQLQDQGMDTVDANLKLGFDVDLRTFGESLAVLEHLGLKSARLYSNNPQKAEALRPIVREVVPLNTSPNEHSIRYLKTKRDRLHHRVLLSEVHSLGVKSMPASSASGVYTAKRSLATSRHAWMSERSQFWAPGARTLSTQVPCRGMYTVQVKDRVMLAHSFQGAEFGPAQKLHGMTAVVYAAFMGPRVHPNNMLVDIGDAFGMLARALDAYRYRNLDDLVEFTNDNTTVERLCRAVFDSIAQELACRENRNSNMQFSPVERLRIRIEETDIALAEYEAPLHNGRQHVLLDMDGVMYKNKGVEYQIISGLEAACKELGFHSDIANELHAAYGSTFRGLLKKGLLQGEDAIKMAYQRAYDSIDLSDLRADLLLRRQIETLAQTGNVQFWIASNSPSHFVNRVLRRLGLDREYFHVVCPSSGNGWANKPGGRYYEQLPQRNACLFDDSAPNIQTAEAVGLQAIQVDSSVDVMVLVADWLGVVPRSWRLEKDIYLRAKERADLRSLNSEVLAALRTQLSTEVRLALETEAADTLRVLDIGAGLLSMLRVLVGAVDDTSLPIRYVAVDHDEGLLTAAAERLRTEFSAQEKASNASSNTWLFELDGHQVEVELRHSDLLQILEEPVAVPYNLIIGCSILDLIDVRKVSAALKKQHAGTLLYFPIHYVGHTAFEPSSTTLNTLSDNYNDSLVARGQVTHLDRLAPLLGDMLEIGESTWNLDLQEDTLLYKQLVSFMAVNALGYHPRLHITRAVASLTQGKDTDNDDRLSAPHLQAKNLDFLMRVPFASGEGAVATEVRHRKAVEFAGPGIVRVVQEELPARRPGEMTVRTILSAISAGTERRVLLSGQQTEGEPLDVSLAALSKDQAPWPIRYGYCLVGHVEASQRFSSGARVFCFHPHASVAHVAEADAREVPGDITDKDAAFFANMETACALVQDAGPLIGERVAVFGAGTVGMLTSAVLAHHQHDVTIFDPQGTRCAALCKQFPKVHRGAGSEFDLCIEVAGAPGALAEAVKKVRRGGKVVVGGLHREEEVPLPVGLRFHRSEMTLVASQVSRVAAPLATRWTKKRREELVWDMLRCLRPAAWIPISLHHIDGASEVYKHLTGDANSQETVQVLLRYE